MANKTLIFKKQYFYLIFVLWLVACGSSPTEPQPPDIAYGRDLCSQCGMIISEARFASAIQLTNGEYLKFDDAGEMFSYYKENPNTQVLAWFVHDYDSESWIRGEEAFFVKSQSLQTPMGTGTISFRVGSKADEFAAEHDGQVYTFDEIFEAQQMDEHSNQ